MDVDVGSEKVSTTDQSLKEEPFNVENKRHMESDKKGEPSKIRKPSGESSTTEFSSNATSTPSSSPLVSAATSLSSTQAAGDDKGESPQGSEDCDLTSSDSSETQTNPA